MDEEKILRAGTIVVSVMGLVASSIVSVQPGAEIIGLFGIMIFSGFIGHWGNK